MKRFKATAIGVLLALVASGVYWSLPYLANPVQTGTPLPYVLRANYALEAREAEKSSILIVGDRQGVKLASFMDALVEATKEKLGEPLRVYNWARKGEGLHRTLAKIKFLKRLPDVIVYHGGSEEFFEQRVRSQSYRAILNNFKAHQDPEKRSWIKRWPQLSKFVYTPHSRLPLGQSYSPWDKTRPHHQNQKMMELTYLTYSAEYRELIAGLKRLQANVVVIPPAHNLDLAPRAVCQNATSPQTQSILTGIGEQIRQGRAPAAVSNLQKILPQMHGHAQAYYLLGQGLKRMGHFKDAKSVLYRAMLYDCWPFRGNMIFNRIQVQIAEKNQFEIIDFNRLVNRQFNAVDSSASLFTDDIYPQDVFYRQVISELTVKVKKILNI